jgi:hypothetical protein
MLADAYGCLTPHAAGDRAGLSTAAHRDAAVALVILLPA